MALHDNCLDIRQSFNELWLSFWALCPTTILNNFPRCSVSVNIHFIHVKWPFCDTVTFPGTKGKAWLKQWSRVFYTEREAEVELIARVLICIYLVNSESQIVDSNKGSWKTKEQMIKTCRDHFLAEDDKNNTKKKKFIFQKMIIPEYIQGLLYSLSSHAHSLASAFYSESRNPFSIGGAARRLYSFATV